MHQDLIAGCLHEINENACVPPLDEEEVESIAVSMGRYETPIDKYFGNMADVEPREVEFLIDQYIPLGCVTILDGDPGVGKSYITANLAASITTGRKWAGIDTGEPKRVLFMSIEDDADAVLSPRLTQHKANLALVDYMEEDFVLDEDGLDILRWKLDRHKYSLVIIDPVTAFMPAGADMYRANEVRGFMKPLAKIAREYNLAVLVVRHLRKAETDSAIHRGIGSIDFIAAVRSALIFAKSKDDDDLRIMAHAKASYSRLGKSQKFMMVESRGRVAWMRWEGESEASADDVLTAASSKPQKLDGAENFLKQILANGPVSFKTVMLQAEARCFSDSTLKRARKELGVKSSGGPNAMLSLPD